MSDKPHSQAAVGPPSVRTEDHLRLLVETGLLLARERNLDVIVQAALDAGLQLCGARFGAFFYNRMGDDGTPYQLYKLSGAATEAFAGFPLPPATALFAETFVHGRILRSNDITQDSHYQPHRKTDGAAGGMPARHIPVRSYLAVPVSTAAGEILGALLYGHPDPNVFGTGCEILVATVAAQAAVALDNARLAENLIREIAVADAARAAQRETADRLERVFEATTDGIALMDRNWRFTYLNRRANEIVSQGRHIAGMHYLEVFPDAGGSVFEQRYAEAMNEGRTVEFTDYYAPLDIWAAIRVFPTADGIAIFFQDVTLQRKAEIQRAESERHLRQALDAAQLGTWTWDVATDLLDLDERAAELLNADPHVPLPRSVLRQRIVNREDIGLTPNDLRETLATAGAYSAEYRIDAGSGGQRWISARGLASFHEGPSGQPGAMRGMIGTVQDITDRKIQEATLRQSEKLAATGRLAATIAHEINNPLEAVTNLIYLSKTDPGVPPSVQRMLEAADGELVRVAQIAQQTLGFYRDTTRPVQVDLNELLSGVVDLFSRKLIYAKLTCQLDLAPDLYVFGLQGEIRQVFSNLLVNAIDAYSPALRTHPGSIRIRGRCCSQRGVEGVSVLIADQGTGISPSARQQLFSPFFTTKPTVGTGLGLWVTRGIVEKHGGAIAFRTRTFPPSGTVFRVFLPLKVANPQLFSSPQSRFLQ